MNFNLKKPCVDCPFVEGSSTNKSLADGRIKSIVHSIVDDDLPFTCHKTLGYDGRRVPKEHCAGAAIFLERIGKHGKPNQVMRIAERIGIYERDQLVLDFEPLIKKKDYY